MNNIKLLVDSSCDLPIDILRKYNIDVIGLNVIFGDDTFIAGEEISNDIFYKKMKESKELPKTSCPSPERFINTFNCNEDNIILLTVSSKLSGTYSSALLAKEIFEQENNKNIEIIDSLNGCAGLGILAIKTAQLIKLNYGFYEVIEKLNSLKDEVIQFGTLDTLENAIKGGRISPLKGVLINSLNFKIVVQVDDGIVKPIDKARGEINSLKKLKEYIIKNTLNSTDKTLVIAHANCINKATKINDMIKEELTFKDVIISEIGPVMGTYTSEGAILISLL